MEVNLIRLEYWKECVFQIGRNNEENGGQRSGRFGGNREGNLQNDGSFTIVTSFIIGRSDRNNEENGGQRTGGFGSNRGGFSDRGGKFYKVEMIQKWNFS